MPDKKKLSEVFKTVGLPPYTYVKPAYYGEVRTDVEQPGRHLLIEGPSGIGKTCVIYKVFEELQWVQGSHYFYVSCRDADHWQRIDAFLSAAETGRTPTTPVLVVDDFHLLAPAERSRIGSRLKRISDRAFETLQPPKLALIGIPTAGVPLLAEAFDLGPRLGIYRLPRASDNEIRKLIGEGESALNVLFEDEAILLSEIAGNFWLGQYICSKVCSAQEVFETQETTRILSFDLLGIRRRLMEELSQKFSHTAVTFSKGKKWRPGGNKPYLEILVALTKIPESVVTFDKILNVVPERRKPGIKAVRTRIPEVIYDPKKSVDLRKQIAFDTQSGFSIEDPLFRYYLTYLEADDLYRHLGVEREHVETSRVYSYDIGFSFAGEVRKIVEIVNEQLKSEDVVTFYDFDQQAVLLAQDLESVLHQIYDESCHYYLVFLDQHYHTKVWAKYEKDILTSSGRQGHIIPVVLDEEGAKGLVGISNTLGRIDLRDVWARFPMSHIFTEDDVNVIRNRCVIPLIEKLDHPHQAI